MTRWRYCKLGRSIAVAYWLRSEKLSDVSIFPPFGWRDFFQENGSVRATSETHTVHTCTSGSGSPYFYRDAQMPVM